MTGGSRGLGLAIADELRRAGAEVAFCARDEDEVARAARSLGSHGVRGHVCDVTDPEAVTRLVAGVERLGGIDVLVNNAGQMTVGPLAHMTRADSHSAMAVHYGGPLNTILAALPGMRD